MLSGVVMLAGIAVVIEELLPSNPWSGLLPDRVSGHGWVVNRHAPVHSNQSELRGVQMSESHQSSPRATGWALTAHGLGSGPMNDVARYGRTASSTQAGWMLRSIPIRCSLADPQ